MPAVAKAIVLLQLEITIRLTDLAQIEHDWEKMAPEQFIAAWGPEITRDTLAVLTKRAERRTSGNTNKGVGQDPTPNPGGTKDPGVQPR